jgi:hypothetical protein
VHVIEYEYIKRGVLRAVEVWLISGTGMNPKPHKSVPNSFSDTSIVTFVTRFFGRLSSQMYTSDWCKTSEQSDKHGGKSTTHTMHAECVVGFRGHLPHHILDYEPVVLKRAT